MFRRALYWLHSKIVQRAERFLLRVLASGPIPKHVAFVMDGNRRHARRKHQAAIEGHSEGFVALLRVLEACLRLRIRCVSVYAFALDNFRRTPEEIDGLMHLAHEKLLEMAKHGKILEEYGVRLNVLGRTSLLPEYVQEAIRTVESVTRNNNKAILNICMPYSSQDEMAGAVKLAVAAALDKSDADGIDICEADIEAHLMTSQARSPPLEILVRTSGVKRLSDYLLWQCCEDTQIHFTQKNWPEFGLLDFAPILLDYQRQVWGRGVAKYQF